ncbi:trypsin-like peptidase domain-containing protein [Reyranella sp.]|uniref:trypsin-like peptidase domain-containing protein n=1 Tax=Reyranella sp. TaxID=1929291 RepID=UPI003D0C20EF
MNRNTGGGRRGRGSILRRAVVLPFVLAAAATALLPAAASAAPIPGSQSQVGAWRVGAYTRGRTAEFDHCALYRVQGDGFAMSVALSARGLNFLAVEAPDWGLTPNEAYTVSVTVGTAPPYTFSGRAISPRAMVLNAAPEVFPQLKSGVTIAVSANQKQYAMSLDGIEAAGARVKDCVRQYAAAAGPPRGSPSSGPPPSGLVTSIQVLLARLGYDPGPPNGTVGLKTNMAISAFQKSRGEPGDGVPSEALRAKLERAVAERSAAAEGRPGTPPNAGPPGAGTGPGAVPPSRPPARDATTTGTGFYIGPDTLVTNYHVAGNCRTIRVRKSGADLGAAKVIALSRSDDLAALRTEAPSKSFLKLRAGAPIKPAEAVLVFGYPLAGALSSTGNTTLGNVTALTGMNDDSRFIQISAAVQPGNSGGAALDESGRVMGVVVSKLNALAIARVTGDIPQNVNFAIKVATLVSFLEAHNVAYEADTVTRELSNTQRAERAEAGSAQLECRK